MQTDKKSKIPPQIEKIKQIFGEKKRKPKPVTE